MAKISAAKKTIINAFNMLLNIRDQTSGLTAAQKSDISTALSALKLEYVALSGVDPNATYSEITHALTTAKTNLESIRKQRNQLKNTLTSVQKIWGSMNAVIGLIT
ncbi:MAG: hypothetical protein ACSHWS_15975 [Sulfitobacter sp.]